MYTNIIFQKFKLYLNVQENNDVRIKGLAFYLSSSPHSTVSNAFSGGEYCKV